VEVTEKAVEEKIAPLVKLTTMQSIKAFLLTQKGKIPNVVLNTLTAASIKLTKPWEWL